MENSTHRWKFPCIYYNALFFLFPLDHGLVISRNCAFSSILYLVTSCYTEVLTTNSNFNVCTLTARKLKCIQNFPCGIVMLHYVYRYNKIPFAHWFTSSLGCDCVITVFIVEVVLNAMHSIKFLYLCNANRICSIKKPHLFESLKNYLSAELASL